MLISLWLLPTQIHIKELVTPYWVMAQNSAIKSARVSESEGFSKTYERIEVTKHSIASLVYGIVSRRREFSQKLLS